MQTITTNLKCDIEFDRDKGTLYIRDSVKARDLYKIKYELALLGFGRCNLVIGKNFDGLQEEQDKKIENEKIVSYGWQN